MQSDRQTPPLLLLHTFSWCVTRLRSQEEAFSRITLRIGCQFSEISEPSVTEARTLTCLLLGLVETPRTYRDCFPTSLSGFRYKLPGHKAKNTKSYQHKISRISCGCVDFVMSCLLNSVNTGVLPAGVHQSQTSIVSNVVIGNIELLQWVVLEPLSEFQRSLVTESSVHKGQVHQSFVLWQSLHQCEESRILQRVVTQPAQQMNSTIRHVFMSF